MIPDYSVVEKPAAVWAAGIDDNIFCCLCICIVPEFELSKIKSGIRAQF